MEPKEENIHSDGSMIFGLGTSTDICGEDTHGKLERKISECKEEAELLKESKKNIKSEKLREKIEKLMNKYHNSKLVRTFDKVVFVFGLLRLIFEAFILGRYPCYYPIYYSIATIILVFLRFIYYRWIHWHYYLLDFCYWANLMEILFFWFFPNNEFLFISSYAFSMGTLLLAIPIFRISMVLHSLEKTTSVFIHLAPGLSIWAARYNNCQWPVCHTTPTIYSYLFYPCVLYLIWALIYYVIIFVISFERCEKKNNTTLFRYLLENKNSIFYKYSGILGEKVRPLAFMFIHMILTFVTFVVTFISFYSQWLQLILILIAIIKTFWATATYYMEIFSKNYELKLEELDNIRKSLGDVDKKDQ
jgi:hypothetical protein